jgi:ADP-heptose:LPS heptosyltransferase
LLVTVLASATLAPIWTMHPCRLSILPLEKGMRGTWEALRILRAEAFQRAFVLFHSARAAFLPLMAGIPHRSGLRVYRRGPLLTRAVPPALEGVHRSAPYQERGQGGHERPAGYRAREGVRGRAVPVACCSMSLPPFRRGL